MRKYLIMGCLLLAGCGRVTKDYQPQLSEMPKDAVQYEIDRKFCISDAGLRIERSGENHQDDERAIAGLGVIGYAIASANADPNDDYFKTPGQIVDECMTAKGYKVVLR